MFSLWAHWSFGAECRGKTERRTPEICTQGKGVGSCEEEKQETSHNVPLVTIDLGSFEVLSDHGDTVEDDVVVDESSEKSQGSCHRCLLLLPGSKRQGLQCIQRCIVRGARNVAMATIVETAKSLLSLIVGMSSLK